MIYCGSGELDLIWGLHYTALNSDVSTLRADVTRGQTMMMEVD